MLRYTTAEARDSRTTGTRQEKLEKADTVKKGSACRMNMQLVKASVACPSETSLLMQDTFDASSSTTSPLDATKRTCN
eukprot:6210378-Pleurochrysis_carterae.AAC.2